MQAVEIMKNSHIEAVERYPCQTSQKPWAQPATGPQAQPVTDEVASDLAPPERSSLPARLDSGWVAGVGQPGGLGAALGRRCGGAATGLMQAVAPRGGKGPSCLGLGLRRPPLQQGSWTSLSSSRAPSNSKRLDETNATHDLNSGDSRTSLPLHSTEEEDTKRSTQV